MKLKILLLSLLIAGCAQSPEKPSQNTPASKTEKTQKAQKTQKTLKKPKVIKAGKMAVIGDPTNASIIRVVPQPGFFARQYDWSNIKKIINDKKETIYSASLWDGKSAPSISLPPGRYTITYSCHFNNLWNDNWVKVDTEADGDYTIFCLQETRGKTIIGIDNVVAFHSFFEKTSELEPKKAFYKKIIANPPKENLSSSIPPNHTRLVVYFLPGNMLGTENRFNYDISLNGKEIDFISGAKYVFHDITNGTYDFSILSEGLFKMGAKFPVSANGGTLYIKCQESSLLPMKCEQSSSEPEGFSNIKPMRMF